MKYCNTTKVFFKNKPLELLQAAPRLPAVQGLARGSTAWGSSPILPARKVITPWDDPDLYLQGSKGEAGENIAENIHQP